MTGEDRYMPVLDCQGLQEDDEALALLAQVLKSFKSSSAKPRIVPSRKPARGKPAPRAK